MGGGVIRGGKRGRFCGNSCRPLTVYNKRRRLTARGVAEKSKEGVVEGQIRVGVLSTGWDSGGVGRGGGAAELVGMIPGRYQYI